MCEFCNGKKKKIENGYTYGNAYIKSTTTDIAIKFFMIIAVENMERESLKSIFALSVVESWWKNERNYFIHF